MATKKRVRTPAKAAASRGRYGKAAAKAAASGQLRSDRTIIRRLRQQLSAALKRIDELQASADTDFLLGIPNRRGFEHELQRAVAYIKRYRASGALILLDVDRLKPVNDAFGRLGGDEFALLLWNLSETDARAKATVLEADIDALTFTFDGQSITAGASAGVTILGPSSDAATALEEADSAMYVRKAQRRHELPAIRASNRFAPAAQAASAGTRR